MKSKRKVSETIYSVPEFFNNMLIKEIYKQLLKKFCQNTFLLVLHDHINLSAKAKKV